MGNKTKDSENFINTYSIYNLVLLFFLPFYVYKLSSVKSFALISIRFLGY